VSAIAAVLFDLDDTLLDRHRTVEEYLTRHAARAKLRPDVAAAYRSRFHELDEHGHAPRAAVFARLGAEFPAVGSAEALEEGIAKPAIEIFHRAADRLGVRPEQCVFVGDNPLADVDGSRRAGMLDVWIEREFPWPGELTPASHSITSLAAVPRLLELANAGGCQRV